MSEKRQTPLSVVVPAWNEEARIREPLCTMAGWLERRVATSELVVVDDGSTDRTAEVVREVAARVPVPVRLLVCERNRGKGRALAVGFAAARHEQILFTDADLSTPIEEADRLLPALDAGADLAIGSRRHADAHVAVRQPILRIVMGSAFTLLVRLSMAPVSDATCGFKAFRGEAGKDLFSRLRVDDWAFDAEVLFLARRAGYAIHEVGVRWEDREGTKVNPLLDAVRSLRNLLRIRVNAARGLYDHPVPPAAAREVSAEAASAVPR
jgi:dolichyl-phosphate beta-glucosyltransferase